MPVQKPRGTSPSQTSASPQSIVALPTTINLAIYEGDDFFLDMNVTDAAGNPAVLDTSQPMSQIRSKPDDPNILASLDITIDGTTPGLLHLHINAADSVGLPASCAWDIQLTFPNIITLAAGTVAVTPQVTQ